MALILLVLYMVMGLGVAWILVHVARLVRDSLRRRGRPRVARSARDRRRVFIPVPFDRRKGARRQDDQAMEYLRRIEG